jgi:hypothetical protein
MNPIIFFWIDTDLCDSNHSGKHGMISEEYIIEIDFTCLLIVDEVTVSVVDTVE